MSLLAVRDLTRRFGALTALDAMSFDLHEGTILAVIGPNGAGKSTLFNLLTGFDRPDAGVVTFDGMPMTGLPAHRVVRRGLSRTFQNTQLFETMTAAENVLTGRHIAMRAGMLSSALRLPHTWREERVGREEVARLLRLVGLEAEADVPAADLPHGQRRLLEVARALASGPKLLLLDEPAAGLNNTETDQLGHVLRTIRDSGVTIVIVEHDMGLVMDISDEIVVMHQGRKIAEGPPLLIQKDPVVIEAYLGEATVDA